MSEFSGTSIGRSRLEAAPWSHTVGKRPPNWDPARDRGSICMGSYLRITPHIRKALRLIRTAWFWAEVTQDDTTVGNTMLTHALDPLRKRGTGDDSYETLMSRKRLNGCSRSNAVGNLF